MNCDATSGNHLKRIWFRHLAFKSQIDVSTVSGSAVCAFGGSGRLRLRVKRSQRMLSRSRRVSIAAQTGVHLKCTICGISSPAGKARTWLGLGLGLG